MEPSHPERAPDMSGYSLANVAEIVLPCLDAVGARSVMEVGAYRGVLTAELLEWAAGRSVEVVAIEPEPPEELLDLSRRHPELRLVRKPSHEAIPELPPPDAAVIDGDHNYYTLSEELRLIAEGARDARLPLLLFHDVCWPHARRDTYYDPDRVPESERQPLAKDVAVAPGVRGTTSVGLHYPWAAREEGGPRNGVLTAIEDFVAARSGLRLAIVPAFFGLGVLWAEDAPWAGAVAEIVDTWDRNPVIARLEANRVAHIVDRARMDAQEALLRSLLNSRAFSWAERLSRLRQRGEPVFSREQVRSVLGDYE